MRRTYELLPVLLIAGCMLAIGFIAGRSITPGPQKWACTKTVVQGQVYLNDCIRLKGGSR